MNKDDISRITPLGRGQLKPGSSLAGTPLAALFALTPHATLGQVQAVIPALTAGGVA